MKTLIAIACVILTACCAFAADDAKPKIKVAADGFPAGHDTPEGVACDLVRAFIKHDAALFTNTCIILLLWPELRVSPVLISLLRSSKSITNDQPAILRVFVVNPFRIS